MFTKGHRKTSAIRILIEPKPPHRMPVMVDKAQAALLDLAAQDPTRTCHDLDMDAGCGAVMQAMTDLAAVVRDEPRADHALDLFRERVQRASMADSAERRAAMLAVMLARGTARRHVPLAFDATLLDDAIV